MYHPRQWRHQQPRQPMFPRVAYSDRDFYAGQGAQAFPGAYVTNDYETSPHHFYAPSARPVRSYGYDASPYYGYEAYEDVDAPSAMDVLDWEEQQLLAEEARLAEERKRVLAEKRRLQAAAAEEQRIRQWKAEQARRQKALKQQQLAEAQRQAQIQAAIQQQIRQRQLTAQKEAQLESALRDLEYTAPFAPSEQIKHCVCPNHARAQKAKSAPKREQAPAESQHPFGWLVQAFAPACRSEDQGCSRAPRARTASPKNAASTSSASPAAATSSASYSAPKATTNTNTKRSEAVNIVQQLKERLTAATKKVGDLISTQFAQLSIHQFGKLDSELMQILLALDGVADSNKDERKALVKETMDLLSQVDQYKDEFSRSSSEDSSSHSSEMDVSEPEENVSEPEEVVEDIDADSNASDAESAVPVPASVVIHPIEPSVEVEAEPAQVETDILPESSHESNAMDVSDELEAGVIVEEAEEENVEEFDADDENEYVEEIDEIPAPAEPSSNDDLADSYAKPIEESNASEVTDTLEESLIEPSEAVPVEDDPFGFSKIHAASKSETVDLQRSSVPIQIGGARKATVSIETAPASQ